MTIDAASNTVSVIDNGIGIPEPRLHEMLAPGGGDKDGNGEEVGEKGVGLTYVVFSGNNFSIESKIRDADIAGGKVQSAQAWLNEYPGSCRPLFLEESISTSQTTYTIASPRNGSPNATYPLDSYTKISVGNITPVEGDINIFSLTGPQLTDLIRTRTAVGVTRRLINSGEPFEFDFYLTLKLPSGQSTEKIDACYRAPHELVKDSDRISLQAVRDAFVSKTDVAARRKFVGSKTIYSVSSIEVEGWKVDVYGVMFPENSTFRQLSKKPLNLISDDTEESEGAYLFQSGIFVGTKGMPTGMRIEPKAGGRYPAYYKRCFFLVESADLKFDLGRKSLHYKFTRRLQNAVAELFSKFEDIAPSQGEGRPVPNEGQKTEIQRKIELQTEWSLARGLADLGETSIPFAKIPSGQEAAVAAIFHELLGARELTGYRAYKTGYGARYDMHALCTVSDGQSIEAVIEFKHNLQSLIKDLEDGRKSFTEVNLLVAWDADVQLLKKGGFDLDIMTDGYFNGVTHSLTIPVPGVSPIEVILLRTFFDRKRSTK
ncbi:hypothetical protein IMF22_01480 [Pseudomonas poae]|uniref:Uncharacterized protein n=1 Tax=Pseudomonas poae TaxID=200451 RepID=A0A7M1KKW1_9PSED|nr:ATP-binding protein [Pseudomonas poae]QOQ75779.1 hypothetical protein IMF22_01480 [Pseudomonas poae]